MSLTSKMEVIRDLKLLPRKDKPYPVLLWHLLIFLLVKKGRFKAFFLLRLHEKNNRIKEYVTENEYRKQNKYIAPQYYRCLLEDKILFFRYMNGLKMEHLLPENLGYLTRQSFFSLNGEKNLKIEELADLSIDSFAKEHCGCCGQNIFKLKTGNGKIFINESEACVADLQSRVTNRCVIQKTIIQHEALNRIYPHSVNTMRVVSCNNGEKVSVYTTLLRLGRSGSYVDNTAAGNLIIEVDRETGRLAKHAYSMKRLRDMYLTQHPDTGFVFEGHQLPFFRESLETCCSLHSYFDMFMLLGWDVAFTPEGYIILECNNISDLNAYQVVGGGMRKRLVKDLSAFRN